MATRPKSLKELNSLYDKSKEAQNAIKKQSSAITDAGSTSRASANEVQAAEEAPVTSASRIASQELSRAVDEFIKTFGEAKDPLQDMPPAKSQTPIPKVVKATSQRTKAEVKAEAAPLAAGKETPTPEAGPTAKEKPILISNSEKSELFAEYMKIMNDEDEDSSSGKSKLKLKKKSKKDKHVGSPVFDQPAEEQTDADNEAREESPASEQEASADIPESAVVADTDNTEQEADSFSFENEEFSQKDKRKKKKKKRAGGKTKAEKKAKKRKLLQIFIMLLLLFVLTSAVGTSLLKVAVGVNTGKPFADKYYVFTSSVTIESVGVIQGDLIITEEKPLEENAPFAYMENGTVRYALKGTQLSDDILMAHSDGEVKQIPSDQLKGGIIKTVPSLGTVCSFAVDNFLIITAALVTIALALILVLAFAFKGSPAEYGFDDEDEDSNEADEELEEDTAQASDDDASVSEHTAYIPSDEDAPSDEDELITGFSDEDDGFEDYFSDGDDSFEYTGDKLYNEQEPSDGVPSAKEEAEPMLSAD